jgi:hypothetical protein
MIQILKKSSPFFFFFFSLFLCIAIIKVKFFSETEKEIKINAPIKPKESFEMWMQDVTDLSFVDIKENKIDLNSIKNTVLINYTDVPGEGCRECMGLEVTDWCRFKENEKLNESCEIILVVSKVLSLPRLLQELKSMEVNIVVVVDSNQSSAKLLNSYWTPHVFFLRYGKVIASYKGDMNDRGKTEDMMNKYKFFLKLSAM